MAPEPESLASVVTKIFDAGICVRSFVVRHFVETAKRLMLSNVCWCLVVQGGKVLSQSFFVRWSRMVMCLANFGNTQDLPRAPRFFLLARYAPHIAKCLHPFLHRMSEKQI